METRKILPTIALTALLAPLGACVTQGSKLAANEGRPLERCDQITGTRITVRPGGVCETQGQRMKTYSAEELAQTGKFDVLQALQYLDPSMQ